MITILSYSLTYTDLVFIFLAALLTGMSKTGVHGAGMITSPLMAAVFSGQISSGVLLPILIFADIFGIGYYHRHASWKNLKVLFPWTAAGLVAGTLIGQHMNDHTFRIVMAATILVSVGIMIWLEQGDKERVPQHPVFAAGMGFTGGFTSMVGNLAGSVMALYFLSRRLPKNVYIGTTAWFFAFMNISKVPLHVFVWHTLTWNTLLLDLLFLPAVPLGAVLGILIVKKLAEKTYRWFIIAMTLIAAVIMLV